MSLAFVCLFVDNLLLLRRNSPLLHRYFEILAGATLAVLLATLFLPASITVPMVLVTCAAVILSTFTAGIVAWMTGHRAARYFIIASASVVVGSVVLILVHAGVLSANPLTRHALQLGSALGVVLWSLALADRINSERAERYLAQTGALQKERLLSVAREQALENERKAREAEQRSLRMEQKANRNLEDEVRRRTEELQQVLKDLSAANVRMTASVGLASTIPDHPRVAAELLAAADAAVYRAKDLGRNRVVVGRLAPSAEPAGRTTPLT